MNQASRKSRPGCGLLDTGRLFSWMGLSCLFSRMFTVISIMWSLAMTESRRIIPVVEQLRPGWAVTLLFVLLFSGPPSFRIRDPEASLVGEIDYVVILRLLVTMAAAIWVLYQWRRRSGGAARNRPLKLRLPQK